MQAWGPRKTQFVMAEAFAIVACLLTSHELFRYRDVIWFVDNEAVCAAAIRGTSSAADVADVVGTVACLSAKLQARVWYEWIDSAANVSDGLSRVGTDCLLARALCSSLREVEPIAWRGLDHALSLVVA